MKLLAFLLFLGSLGVAIAAQDEPAVPAASAAEHYRPIWTRSPFVIASSDDAPKGTWILAGVTQAGPDPLVFLVNRQSQERITVTRQANARGFLVDGVDFRPDPLQTSVRIRTPSEVLTVRFDPALLVVSNPAPAAAAGSGAAGRPAVRKPVTRTVVPNPSSPPTLPAS